jgi:hypothetical protein
MAFQDDQYTVTVKEELVRDALLRSGPEELDKVLTAIEGYRTCVATADRLRRSPDMEEQRTQALDCAGYCEATLREFVNTGQLPGVNTPGPEFASAHLSLSFRW